ncbi:acetyl-CoA carboxylase, carboxyltransferase subunit beta [Hoeflea prorocentri]|uniref:Acetyl-coenzyme A carboxylase carboxyl transferase subunit beta n=1 Tax=Hoeflea prorocentri TaxID=1922333 RepID=A0A9X3UM23_9HYPH|nr:acetyl-CoA carboxylase, carboxyltransferase subunit beta [Hoeflea prorocentri]MCY6383122.1 acetyl-CoA carboxylase, carboxyltransferase subunit beta [Hoeflea prorocentri]MDA5400922.1 acetyl-CoA carboxylase, carboxyltransferase subunit beta [Hoeflea prorocentri]
MNWITSFVRPKINSMLGRRDVPENLWIKCPETGEMVFHTDLEENLWVIPASGYHMKISAEARLKYLFDNGAFEEIERPQAVQDPLKFRDSKKYTDRLRDVRAKTGLEDSIIAGVGTIKGVRAVACAHDFSFIGGSLGVAAGEAIIRAFEVAVEQNCPVVMFAASGGARMQEGILSLMQLPRTTVAVEMLKEAGLPYIVVLTNPTTGGVSASYAMLGDIHIAEPGAEICFAGKRVIEQTIHEKLPEGFQTSEYLMEHGMVDMVVSRHDLPDTLARLLNIMMKKPPHQIDAAPSPDGAVEEPDAVIVESETEPMPAVEAAEAVANGPENRDANNSG